MSRAAPGAAMLLSHPATHPVLPAILTGISTARPDDVIKREDGMFKPAVDVSPRTPTFGLTVPPAFTSRQTVADADLPGLETSIASVPTAAVDTGITMVDQKPTVFPIHAGVLDVRQLLESITEREAAAVPAQLSPAGGASAMQSNASPNVPANMLIASGIPTDTVATAMSGNAAPAAPSAESKKPARKRKVSAKPVEVAELLTDMKPAAEMGEPLLLSTDVAAASTQQPVTTQPAKKRRAGKKATAASDVDMASGATPAAADAMAGVVVSGEGAAMASADGQAPPAKRRRAAKSKAAAAIAATADPDAVADVAAGGTASKASRKKAKKAAAGADGFTEGAEGEPAPAPKASRKKVKPSMCPVGTMSLVSRAAATAFADRISPGLQLFSSASIMTVATPVPPIVVSSSAAAAVGAVQPCSAPAIASGAVGAGAGNAVGAGVGGGLSFEAGGYDLLAQQVPPNPKNLVLELGQLVRGTLLRRPSAHCRTPYVADVLLEDGTETMAHCPAMDGAGMIAPGGNVWLTANAPKAANAPQTKTTHAIQLCEDLRPNKRRTLVGSHPYLGERLCKLLLEQRKVPEFGEYVNVEGQKTYGTTRVDFVLTAEDGSRTLVETKNVMGADFPEGGAPEGRSIGIFTSSAKEYYPTALFPHGTAKPKIKVVSDRAIKHIHELTLLHQAGQRATDPAERLRCGLLFVVNRGDCAAFRPCDQADPLFAQLVKKAEDLGMLVLAYDIQWVGSSAFLGKRLPVVYGEDTSPDIDMEHLKEVLEFNATDPRKNWKTEKKRVAELAAAAAEAAEEAEAEGKETEAETSDDEASAKEVKEASASLDEGGEMVSKQAAQSRKAGVKAGAAAGSAKGRGKTNVRAAQTDETELEGGSVSGGKKGKHGSSAGSAVAAAQPVSAADAEVKPKAAVKRGKRKSAMTAAASVDVAGDAPAANVDNQLPEGVSATAAVLNDPFAAAAVDVSSAPNAAAFSNDTAEASPPPKAGQKTSVKGRLPKQQSPASLTKATSLPAPSVSSSPTAALQPQPSTHLASLHLASSQPSSLQPQPSLPAQSPPPSLQRKASASGVKFPSPAPQRKVSAKTAAAAAAVAASQAEDEEMELAGTLDVAGVCRQMLRAKSASQAEYRLKQEKLEAAKRELQLQQSQQSQGLGESQADDGEVVLGAQGGAGLKGKKRKAVSKKVSKAEGQGVGVSEQVTGDAAGGVGGDTQKELSKVGVVVKPKAAPAKRRAKKVLANGEVEDSE